MVDTYAIVEQGGHQYRVEPGMRLHVDRMPIGVGSEVKIEKVLLYHNGEQTLFGTPYLVNVEVKAKVVSHELGKKVRILRYKPKKRVRVHKGARHHYTVLEFTKVGDVEAKSALSSSDH